ncbi:hypothetical protein T440DRAFT_467043 [Plenodomus tracheiphilus IPT5]|uniref:Uncharacterized protein n=1 Tax=Plenodomus tracheiphilus IPT5 TaxID=1408161 RepID=A0A6A7BA16_9PLEO|nr:hypothetical protein T440DRAFT_467043 [Plenodomus tracheiphilus IPT5]
MRTGLHVQFHGKGTSSNALYPLHICHRRFYRHGASYSSLVLLSLGSWSTCRYWELVCHDRGCSLEPENTLTLARVTILGGAIVRHRFDMALGSSFCPEGSMHCVNEPPCWDGVGQSQPRHGSHCWIWPSSEDTETTTSSDFSKTWFTVHIRHCSKHPSERSTVLGHYCCDQVKWAAARMRT